MHKLLSSRRRKYLIVTKKYPLATKNSAKLRFDALSFYHSACAVFNSPKERDRVKEATEKLMELDGARFCRRNFWALAVSVVIVDAMSVDPGDLDNLDNGKSAI